MYQSITFNITGITAIYVQKNSKIYDLNRTLMEEEETLKFSGESGRLKLC